MPNSFPTTYMFTFCKVIAVITKTVVSNRQNMTNYL